MAKILSVVKSNKNYVNLHTIRFMVAAAAPNDTKIRYMRPPNSIPVRGLSDQIDENKEHSSSVSSSPVRNCHGNPCIDLFFNFVQPSEYTDEFDSKKRKKGDIEAEVEDSCTYLKQLLPVAWCYNPLTTLKLIVNLHDDKFNQEAFQTALYWLHHNHPKTLLCNIEPIAKSFAHSLFELFEILYRLLQGQNGRRGRNRNTLDMAKKAVERYEHDPDYRLLHDQVADVYVEYLKSDLEKLKKQKLKPSDINPLEFSYRYFDDDDDHYEKVTDAAGSCSHLHPKDRHTIGSTLLLNSIARKVFPRESYPEYQGVEEADYTNKVRDRLRKEFLVPLNMYSRSSKTRKSYEGKGYDADRYNTKLLKSKLNEEPWKGKAMCFDRWSADRNLIQGNDVRYKCEFLWKMGWSRSDYEEVLDLLLQVAVDEDLKPEHMIKKVFVFTRKYDEDPFTDSCWAAKYKAMQSKYKEKGYGDAVPHFVRWNLSEYEEKKPVIPRILTGVTILTGFCRNFIKLFLDNDGEIGPQHLMEFAISGKRYQSLSVVD